MGRAHARRVPASTAWRIAALLAACAPLVATTVPHCPEGQTASYDAATRCGPAGVATFSFEGRENAGCCDSCRVFVDATGANAVGLPERGEIFADRAGFDDGDFVLVGPVPLAGSSPPVTVDRVCRFAKAGEDGALAVTCEGAAPDAECAGTLTRRIAP